VSPSFSLSRRSFDVVSAGAILLLASCSSLKPVADFGKNGSSVAGFPGVAEDYPQSLERQRLYGQTGSSVSDENIAKRKRDAQRLLQAQKVLEAYARALGALASDDLISYDKELDALNKSLVDAKFATSAQTDGYAKAAKFGFRFVTDFYRRAKIKRLIITYNPSVQSATANWPGSSRRDISPPLPENRQCSRSSWPVARSNQRRTLKEYRSSSV